MIPRSSLLVFLILLNACVTTTSVRKAPVDSGIQGTYPGTPQEIKEAAIAALNESGFVPSENEVLDPSRWRLMATHEPAHAPGHIARVIGESKESETLVRILVLRSGSKEEKVDPADPGLAQAIHERLARKLGRPAPAPGGTRGKTVNVGIEKKCGTELSICFDAIQQLLRDRDYRIVEHARPGQDQGTISAQGRGFSVTVALSRVPGNRTRIVLQADGRADQENRDEELSLLDLLRKKLLEPLD